MANCGRFRSSKLHSSQFRVAPSIPGISRPCRSLGNSDINRTPSVSPPFQVQLFWALFAVAFLPPRVALLPSRISKLTLVWRFRRRLLSHVNVITGTWKIFKLLLLKSFFAGPSSLRRRWVKSVGRPRGGWRRIERPLDGPDWFDRQILKWAGLRLQIAKEEDRVWLLRVIMQHGYAFDSFWRPNFTDETLRDNPEFLYYLFDFPMFISSHARHERMIRFIERLFTDLEQLHAVPLDEALRAEVAECVTRHFSFLPALFSEVNLRPLASAAGKWTETHLRMTGRQLDFNFESRRTNERLRVGVFVNDFEPRNESFLVLPFGLGLDRHRFELVLVTRQPPPTCAFGATVKEAFERIEVVDFESVDERVSAIRALDLDFLIIANYVAAQASDVRHLLTHRLARLHILTVAISPSTTGFPTTDIVLTARNTEPNEQAEKHYTETVHWLEGTFNCFGFGPRDPRKQDVDVADVVKVRASVVFACGGVIYKLTPALRQSLINILKSAPDSALILYPFNPNWSLNLREKKLCRALLNEFTDAGISPGRIQILSPLTPAQIFRMMQHVTVYLDTFPFSGGASLIEPILAGCPIVTLRGRTQRGLLGTGMMRALGMDFMVASNAADYESKALEIAHSPELRASLSRQLSLAAKEAPFLDPDQFGQRLGKALELIASPRILH